MLERQREGIDIAKEEGKYKGRKPIEKRSCSKCGPSSRVAQVLAKQSLKQASAGALITKLLKKAGFGFYFP